MSVTLAEVSSPCLPTGEITLPAGFNNQLGITAYWDGSKVQCLQSPYDLIDFEKWLDCNHYYVSYSGDNGNAGTEAEPWQTLTYAVANATSPAVIHLLDERIGYFSSNHSAKQFDGFLKIKGPCIIAAMRETDDLAAFAWSASGGAYKSTTSAARFYRAQFDGKYRDENGIPRPIVAAADQSECESTPGTYWWDGSALYVHMHDGRIPDPNDGWLFGQSPYDFEVQQIGTGTILLEDLEFVNNNGSSSVGAGVRYRPVTAGSPTTDHFGMKNCRVYGPSSNGIQVYDAEVCVMEDVHTGYTHIDGFNYHSFVSTGTKGEFITVYEHNCTSKYSGFDLFADQAALGTSCNGSTAHDSMHILRTNSVHGNSNGAVVADVNGVCSVNLNVQAGRPTGTASPKACFWHDKYAAAGTTQKMYLWGCAAHDDGDSVNLIDNTGQSSGSPGEVLVKYWRGQTDGSVVGTLETW